MSDEYRIMLINKAIAVAQIEAMGMVAENTHRVQCGNSIAYGEEAFQAVIQRLEAAFEVNRL